MKKKNYDFAIMRFLTNRVVSTKNLSISLKIHKDDNQFLLLYVPELS